MEQDVIHYLRTAALHPQRRGEMIARALQELLISLPALGTALIWPCLDRNAPWKVYYAGDHPESMRRWLAARLNVSLDATLGVLQKDLTKLTNMPQPQLIYLQPAPVYPAGLWIVWTAVSPLPAETSAYIEKVRTTLEALIEVERLEEHYFSDTSPLSDQALIKSLGQGDPRSLSTLLSMMRLVGDTEMAVWGQAYRDVIETIEQLGAKRSDFGFTLPRGRGMGGYIITSNRPILTVEDYRNSPYRPDPNVSAIVEGERLRTVIALPVRSHIGQESNEHIVGILYAARRNVKPFSLAEQLLMQRLASLLEPLPPPVRPTSFLSPGLPVSEQKAEWHKLILQANRIETLETWVNQFIKGTIIVTDCDGRPYVFARTEQLEHLRASFDNSTDGVQAISLDALGVPTLGRIYLRSGITLPPADWPDFFADLVMACNLIIGRMEQALDHLARQREQWLHSMLQEKPIAQIRQDGYRLGLPVGEGQLWVIAWPPQKMLSRQAARKRMLAEDIVLNQLESPLLFFGEDIGVILLDEHTSAEPAKLRDALITQFAPYPLWIVYGAHYHSLHDLKTVLTHSLSLAQKARREGNSEYLLNVEVPGLESLLANPQMTEDLHTFANKLLKPLLEYDESRGTDLITTFVLAQMLGSTQEVGDELGVHVNTIRYRLRKAEDILGIDEASPKERIAWGLASFIWMDSHPSENTMS